MEGKEPVGRRSFSEVYEHLRQLVCRELDQNRSRLPPERTLARLLGCSLVTAHKAVTRLAAEGIVEPVPRRGTRILQRPEPALPEPQSRVLLPTSALERLKRRLAHDVLHGRHPFERLPSIKEMAVDYGCGRDLLRAALASLVDQGYLERNGRGYAIPATRQAPSLTLHLVAIGDNMGLLGQQAPHQLPLLEQLEETCRRRSLGFRAHILPRGFGHPSLSRAVERELRRAAADSATAGFVVCHLFISPRLREHILQSIAGPHPTALLDDSGQISIDTRNSLPHNWHLFTVTQSALCGRIAARYLVERGHRRLAFVGAYPKASWQAQRFEGARQACLATAGLAQVRLFTASAPPREQWGDASRSALSRAIVAHLPDTLLPTPGHEAATAELLRDEMLNAVERHRQYAALYHALEPAMAEASAWRDITAWIACNDGVAQVCLQYLNANGIDVPRDLSLVSFDDSQIAARTHISSYNFNPYDLSAAMIGYVLDPFRFRRAHPEPVTEIPGFVRERRSVASVTP